MRHLLCWLSDALQLLTDHRAGAATDPQTSRMCCKKPGAGHSICKAYNTTSAESRRPAGEASAQLPDSVVPVGASASCCASERVPPGSLHAHHPAEEGMPGLAQQCQLEGQSAQAPAGCCAAPCFWVPGKGFPRVDLSCPSKHLPVCSEKLRECCSVYSSA